MGYKATVRAMEAAQRREQRDSQRRLRELERQAKEQAKLSVIEQARLEVETFDGQLLQPLRIRFGIAHLQVFERFEDDAGNDQTRILFVIGWPCQAWGDDYSDTKNSGIGSGHQRLQRP